MASSATIEDNAGRVSRRSINRLQAVDAAKIENLVVQSLPFSNQCPNGRDRAILGPLGLPPAPASTHGQQQSQADRFMEGIRDVLLPAADGRVDPALAVPELVARVAAAASGSTHPYWAALGDYVGGLLAHTAAPELGLATNPCCRRRRPRQ